MSFLIDPYRFAGGTTYADEVLADSPLAYWRLEEASGSVLDSSGNSLSGTNNGATTGATGKVGNGYDFDGTNDYIDFGEPASLDFTTTAFTLEAWVNLAASFASGYQTIVGKWFDNNARSYLICFGSPGAGAIVDGVVFFHEDSSSVTRFIKSTAAQSTFAGSWTHIAATFDPLATSTERIKLYVNGSLDTSGTSGTGTEDSARNVLIGDHDSRTAAFNGLIDEVAIYGTPLSATRILAHYNAA